MIRQFLVGGGISIANIAIHALVMTVVVQVAQAASAKNRSHSSLILIAVMIPTVSELLPSTVVATNAKIVAVITDIVVRHLSAPRLWWLQVRQRLDEIVRIRIRYGYRRAHVMLKRDGWPIGSAWFPCNFVLAIPSSNGSCPCRQQGVDP